LSEENFRKLEQLLQRSQDGHFLFVLYGSQGNQDALSREWKEMINK
jgi:hypothetical protein